MYRFVWTIELDDPGNPEPFIETWREGSKIIQQYAGALGTHLHTIDDSSGSYLAVAEWDSNEARDAMTADITAEQSEQSIAWQALPRNESFGKVLIFAGVEIEAVMPNNA